MKIVRFRSKAIIFLIVFTTSILIITRIAVVSIDDTSAANNKELLGADLNKKDKKIGKLSAALGASDRRAFYDFKSFADVKSAAEAAIAAAVSKQIAVDKEKRSFNPDLLPQWAKNGSVATGVKNLPPFRLNAQKSGNLNNVSNHTFVNSKFIPDRRIVHLDLKGAAPKVFYFELFFRLIKNLGATGVLIEWEDTFPYSGPLEIVRSVNAYTEEEIRTILTWAKDMSLDVIPLVQTFGHLEWILKHTPFSKLREVERYAQVICLSNNEAVELVKTAIDQVMVFHKDQGEFFHIGADEAFQVCNNGQA